MKIPLSQSFRNRLASVAQAKEKFLNDVIEDINNRVEHKRVTLESIATGAGLHYSLVSLVRNRRRPPTKDFIYKYTKYLEGIGE